MLAGGRGLRAWPLTSTRPKALLPVLGETLLGRLLRQAHEAGLQDVCVVADQAEGAVATEALQAGHALGLAVEVRAQPGPGTGEALHAAADLLEKGPALVLHADMVLGEAALPGFLHAAKGKGPCMGIAQVDDVAPFATLRLDGPRVRSVAEKSSSGPGWTNAGCMILGAESPALLASLPVTQRGEKELTSALDALAKSNALCAAPLQDWTSVDWPWDLLKANEAALAGVRRRLDGEVHPGCVLEGEVIVERGARLAAGVVVQGPAYIGPGASVGPNAWVRPGTVLGAEARIGHGCEVKASVLLRGARVNHLSYVGDSVLGEGASLGAGTMVANLRHDGAPVRVWTQRGWVGTGRRKLGVVLGDGTRTGVNTSLNAGVLLPAGHRTLPGESVLRSVLP